MFTCHTCNLEFPGAEDQRGHMKSEWHRYNLKRRVAQLPPLEEDTFNTKVAALSLEDEAAAGKKKGEKQITKKEQRRKEKEALQEQKKQILEQARKAMLEKIQKGEITEEELRQSGISKEETPKEEEITKEEPVSTEASETPEELTEEQQQEKILQEKLANKIEIKPTTCLFSHPKENKNFDTVDENIEHMWKTYGLYIPETTYLVDKEGLISYLGEKISFGFCISCKYQGKNAEAAREHMRTKRHMRIPYETEDEKLEISEFYDFSSTYDDYEEDQARKAAKAAKAAKADKAKSTSEEGEDDGEWEDVEDEEGEEGEDNSDEEESDLPPIKDAIYQNGHELILPSGTILGHRSMNRYYRQNLPPDRVLSEGQGTVIAAETRHMLTLKDRQVLAERKRTWGREKKSADVNDRRAQKFINNQPYYRDQLLQ